MIISPFNSVFCILFLFVIASLVLIGRGMRDSSERKKTVFIVSICAFNIALFFVYKYALSIDKDYLILYGIEKFNWFNELPLQLCNINMFLIPIGVITKKRSIIGFSFFIAPLGAFMALIFPESAFSGFSLFLPRIFGYYFTHIIIFFSGLSLAVLGFYRPKVKDFPGISVAVILISFSAHIVNLIFRMTVCSYANYFYTFGADISILNLFWELIPIPYLYELPSLLILFSYMAIVCFVFWVTDKPQIGIPEEQKI